jgi:hypothetical protein
MNKPFKERLVEHRLKVLEDIVIMDEVIHLMDEILDETEDVKKTCTKDLTKNQTKLFTKEAQDLTSYLTNEKNKKKDRRTQRTRKSPSSPSVSKDPKDDLTKGSKNLAEDLPEISKDLKELTKDSKDLAKDLSDLTKVLKDLAKDSTKDSQEDRLKSDMPYYIGTEPDPRPATAIMFEASEVSSVPAPLVLPSTTIISAGRPIKEQLEEHRQKVLQGTFSTHPGKT